MPDKLSIKSVTQHTSFTTPKHPFPNFSTATFRWTLPKSVSKKSPPPMAESLTPYALLSLCRDGFGESGKLTRSQQIIMRDSQTNASRGFGFVDYESAQDLAAAEKALNGFE